ncbi:MAG: WbqC family protein [Planctomycetota bacterium]|jgi:hypothetical protein
MRVTILQPNYIPWRGYFDFFKQSDLFVIYDDVQYTRHDWRNRNTIKMPMGALWLTVPVQSKGCIKNNLLVKDAKICGTKWIRKHLGSMEAAYKKAPYFEEVYYIISGCIEQGYELLIDLNMSLIRAVLRYLGIECRIKYSSDLDIECEGKTERIVKILKSVGATEYLTGTMARGYIDERKFKNIKIVWHDYQPKEYPQLWGDYVPNLSIVDTLFNCGRATAKII